MDPLVEPSWLFSRLAAPDLAILDATLPAVGMVPAPDVRARYEREHIPGAVFFDIEALSDRATTLPHMLPSAESFSISMAALGVSDQMTIVAYEQEGVFSAPRAWWMLRTFGAQQVYVLDGGLRAWREAGYPVQSGTVDRKPARFSASLDQTAVRDFDQVQRTIATNGQIVDARPVGRFAGTSPEPRASLPSGHMPGAINIPYTQLANAGRLRSRDELLQIFGSHAVDLAAPITSSCGSGVTAAVLALGLERCGAHDVSLYDGSWTEYAQRPEAAIESSAIASTASESAAIESAASKDTEPAARPSGVNPPHAS